jgi:DNA-binding transcriptional regulator YiaG
MNKQRCPACGSTDITDEKKSILIKKPFGGQYNIEIHENICSICGTRGDFFNQNDFLIDETIKKLQQKSIENILNYFIDNKMSMSSIERALEIPQRTLTKWKNRTNVPSSAGIALMRFIKLFPWLLEEIDFCKENFIEAGGIVATSGSALLYRYYEKKNINNQEKAFNEVALVTSTG